MQFDVHLNVKADAAIIRYFLSLQADQIEGFPSRVVAPLKAARSFRAHPRLKPSLDVNGETVVMVTNEIVAIEARALGPFVCNLEPERRRIVGALDFLFTGV